MTGSPPAAYVHQHIELAYATNVYGAQGDTVDQVHLLVGDTTTADLEPATPHSRGR